MYAIRSYYGLWYKLGGIWRVADDYAYTAAALPLPEITSPAPGATLSGANETFIWTANSWVVENFALWFGSAP